MEKPSVTLYGKTYTPKSPKMKVWRKFLEFFDEDKEQLSLEEFLNQEVELIVLAFDRAEVTKDAIDDNIMVSDIVPLTRELFLWIQSTAFSKLAKLPNEEAEKA